MDPSDSHQPFTTITSTSTNVPEGVTAQNISPLTTLTPNELNRVEAQVEPDVQPQVETQVEPQVQPEAQPQAPSEAALAPAQPSSNHRPYTDMIYDAVVALNKPEGSSEKAISKYIKRSHQNLHETDHDGLVTHHLRVMENCGVLTKVKYSYKLADSSPPVENAAVAAAAAADQGPVAASGSGIPPTNTSSLDMLADAASGSAPQPQKRGRGRPPKTKPEAPQQQQPINAQPISQVLPPSINEEPSGVQPSGDQQPELPVTNPTQVVTESAKGRPGRPRKDGSGPSGSTANLAVTMKRRGEPASCRAFGRERKPISLPARDSVVPVLADGGAGRPERGGSGGVATLGVEEAMAVAAVMKRGRGRPPKRGGGRGRTPGRPIQETPRPVTRATGTIQEPDYGELKRNVDLANEKAKGIMNVLDVGIRTGDSQAAVQALQELEELIQMMTVEPQATEEVQPEEAAPLIETKGMELGQGSEGGGQSAQIQTPPQPHTLTQPQPQLHPETLPLPQTLTLTQPEPEILSELHNLPQFEPLFDLEPLTLTQPQPQILPPLQPNTEAEEKDDDMFDF